MTRSVRIGYFVSHPIQYQAPLLRKITCESDFSLQVLFCSNAGLTPAFDAEFRREVMWDIPLVDGYDSAFLGKGNASGKGLQRILTRQIDRWLQNGAFDVLWIHGFTRLTNLYAMFAAKRQGAKVMVRDEANGLDKRGYEYREAFRRPFYNLLRKTCDAFLAIGRLNREYYLSRGIDRSKIFDVPYAVDNEFFSRRSSVASLDRETFRRKLGLEPGREVILFTGKLSERKGPQVLAHAYRLLSSDGHSEPHPYLLYVGDGELRSELQGFANQLGWHSIRMLGFKNQTELPALYDLCDVFVLPSFHEPWGLVVNEAMNAAKPIVVSDHVGCGPDLVRPGINGELFKAGDSVELATALKKIFAAERAEEMGQASKRIIGNWSFREDISGLKAAVESTMA